MDSLPKLVKYNRATIKEKLQEIEYDVLVIGGGITGAGIALDATTRGLRTALVEMEDFAFGTSSRSTKLVHGGLRYLQQFEVSLVREVGQERAVVYENGPHVTTPEWMMLPLYRGGTFGRFSSSIGLRIYDYLAGVKRKERRTMLDEAETLHHEPLIKHGDLKGAGYYVEYKTDDARLTIEVLKKALEKGAIALNHAKVVQLTTDDEGTINGAIVNDKITKERFQIYAKKVINAGGPWVDKIREMDETIEGKRLQLTKGVHLVFACEDFPLKQAIYFDAFDGRMIFAIPRGRTTYVGTTDTMYGGDPAHPTVSEEDVRYLLKVINDMFPTVNLTAKAIESSWAGLRPLISEPGKKPGEISRKEEIFISKDGLISMAGGKLTGYRKMAEEAVDTVTEQLKVEEHILYSKSNTKYLPISGGDVGGSAGFHEYKQTQQTIWQQKGIENKKAEKLIQRYGKNSEKILQLYEQIDCHTEDEGLLIAELYYAIYEEMAYKPTDFFIRRTGDLFFDIHKVKLYKELVINKMKTELDWDDVQTSAYQKELEQFIHEAELKHF